jgi:hypothetical protein
MQDDGIWTMVGIQLVQVNGLRLTQRRKSVNLSDAERARVQLKGCFRNPVLQRDMVYISGAEPKRRQM